jgi:hypothetical protein
MAVTPTTNGVGCADGTRKRGIAIPVMTASRGVEEAVATGIVVEKVGTDLRAAGVKMSINRAASRSGPCGIALLSKNAPATPEETAPAMLCLGEPPDLPL